MTLDDYTKERIKHKMEWVADRFHDTGRELYQEGYDAGYRQGLKDAAESAKAVAASTPADQVVKAIEALGRDW